MSKNALTLAIEIAPFGAVLPYFRIAQLAIEASTAQ